MEFVEEYIPVNGINEYVLHYPIKNKPVCMFLHGGPGMTEAPCGYKLQEILQYEYTLVFYDQRGAGRTLIKNPKSVPTLDLLMVDLHQTILYIKSYYHVEQIILVGHSWGTVLGTIYALKHPENVSHYIGIGQINDMEEIETLGFQAVKDKLKELHEEKELKKLEAIEPYPPKHWDEKALKTYNQLEKLKDKYQLSMTVKVPLAKLYKKSPTRFTFKDFFAIQKGVNISNPMMIDLLNQFNLESYGVTYQMPVCFIFGSNDYITPVEAFRSYYDKIIAPRKMLEQIKDAGHYTNLEQPEAFAAVMKKFLVQ